MTSRDTSEVGALARQIDRLGTLIGGLQMTRLEAMQVNSYREHLRKAVGKFVLAWPTDDDPEEDVNVPAYIIDELREAYEDLNRVIAQDRRALPEFEDDGDIDFGGEG